MSIGVDISSLGYDVAPDRYYVYADGRTVDCVRGTNLPRYMRNGYITVSLYMCKTKKSPREYLHRLIGKAFVPNPNNLLCMNHIDGDKTNNSPSNLEWCSKGHNNKHAYRNGLRKNGRGGGHNAPIMCIETKRTFKSITQASEECGIGRGAIQECLSGRNKTCAKMHWKYI